MNDAENTGAIDYVVVEFPRQHATGELVPSLLDLVDREIIRILDIQFVLKHDDDSHEIVDPSTLDPELGFGELVGASSGLLGEEDGAEVASIMEPGNGAMALLYENLWSLPFARAAREAGGQLISTGHIPTQAIVAALDALEA